MHPNEQVLRDVDKAQLSGDFEAFMGFFTDDVVVHVTGRSSLAGDYKGKEQFAEVFGRFSEAVPEYSFEPHVYFADDEHVPQPEATVGVHDGGGGGSRRRKGRSGLRAHPRASWGIAKTCPQPIARRYSTASPGHVALVQAVLVGRCGQLDWRAPPYEGGVPTYRAARRFQGLCSRAAS